MKATFRKIVTGILALMLILSAMPFLSVSADADKNNRTVKVGFFAYPGYHEIEDDARRGYGYDFLALLQRYTNLNYEYVGYEKSWEEMQQMLLNGEIDLVTSARKTEEREKIFDFSEPIGTNNAQINVRIDDDRFIPGDYQALDGRIFGEITGNSRNQDAAEFAKERGFSFKVREYANADELERALREKKIDAAVSSSLRKTSGEKTIAEFAPQDFYVIVKKGNTSLLDEINYGINQMDAFEGNWRDNLYYHNYKANGETVLSFTQKEEQYIREVRNGGKTITVTAQPDMDPYSYVENGKLKGIIPDYFAHLMEMAGLPYTTIAAKDRDEFQEWTLTNHTDVVMDCRFGSAPSTKYEFGLVTDPYMQLTTSRVTRKGFSGTIESIATVDSQDGKYFEKDIAGDVEHLIVPSRENALKAVKDGKADACYVYTYMAEKFINNDPDSELQFTILKEPVYSEYIYISPDTDHELCSILNKCVKADTSAILDEYVKKYTTPTFETLSLLQYLKLHPEIVVVASSLMMLLVILIAIAVFRSRTDRMRSRQMENELERFKQVKGLASQFSVLYFVNLNTLETQSNYLDEVATPDEAKDIDRKSENFFEAFKNSMVQYAHPDFKEEMLKYADPEYVKAVLRNKRRYDYRFLCMNAEGGYSWTDMVLMKFSENEDDEPVNIAVGYYDTDAEMRERLEAFRKNERDLEAIRGLADEYDTLQFVDLDADRYSLYFMVDDSPETAKEMTDEGGKFSEYFRNSMNAFCHPDYLEEMLRFADLDNVRQILSEQNKYTYRFLCNSDKGYQWCEFALIRLDKEEIPKRIAVGYTNIDETIRREMEYQEKLEAANKSKTDFLFNMSHDIRTPMNAIIGFTQIAKKHIDEKERTLDSLNKIESSGNHLLNLINEVLDMSRVEAGKLRSEMKTVNISEAAARIVTICQESADERNISLALNERNIVHPVVVADELHINQIIMNILGNAIKYTQPGGNVTYTVEEISSVVPGYGEYVFTVEDTGIGMSSEFLEHVFESFSREDNASTSETQGTGLGMAIVKRLVDYMDGTIDVESEQGKGTKVTVMLHLMLADNTESLKQNTEEIGTDLVGRKVLLVEDNDLNREIATEILEEQGMEIEEAVNGFEAVELVKRNGADHYDFVLMDIQMPLMDGYTATMEIRKLPGADSLPIIALSANAFEEDKKKSLESGMNDHVSKPIVISELIRALSKFVK